MENNQHVKQINLCDPERIVEIKKHPFMGGIFIKAWLLSFFRPVTIKDDAIIHKTRVILKNYLPDKKQIENYRTVCHFSGDRPDTIPISYLQTLFIGLMGKFVTSSFFPVSPMGLIHVFQSFEQKKPVPCDTLLDLSCRLTGIKKTPTGIETGFSLEVSSNGDIVWQGDVLLFTKSPVKIKKDTKKQQDICLEKKMRIPVPSNTGRKYANVSGDYNPFHLYTVLAKIFGFKRAIAHGMWSLARVTASLEKEFGPLDSAHIDAFFKLPIFMPADTTLGYESQTNPQTLETTVNFELRDERKGLPHLKGKLLTTRLEP
jgi:acyl dehydratase